MSDAPDYPGAIWMPANASRFRSARLGYRRVLLHCTDGHDDPVASAENLQNDNHPLTSFHFVVGHRLPIVVVQCVRITDIAEHAHDCNDDSIAIEHCARTPGELGKVDAGMLVTPDQLLVSAQLCLWLLRLRDLPINRETIQGHAEADKLTTHKDCPTGAGINLDAYVGLVNAISI